MSLRPSRLAVARDAAGEALAGTALTLVTVACVAPGAGTLAGGNADCFQCDAGAFELVVAFPSTSAPPKQVSTPDSALPRALERQPEGGLRRLDLDRGGGGQFCMNCPSGRAGLPFEPMANAVAYYGDQGGDRR